MAAQLSRQLIGRHIEGVWHTGIIVYGVEYYFGGGISSDPPGRTPFGKLTKLIDFRCPNKDNIFRVHRDYLGFVYGIFKREQFKIHLRYISCLQAQLQ